MAKRRAASPARPSKLSAASAPAPPPDGIAHDAAAAALAPPHSSSSPGGLLGFFGVWPTRPLHRKFRLHRVGGGAYLVLYAISIWAYAYAFDDVFLRFSLPLVVALVGLLQAVSAVATFTFLPSNENSGFFGDKGVLSRRFVKENVYYQLQVCFGALYYLHKEALEARAAGYALAACGVFLPYVLLRPLFPTTRLTYTHVDEKVGRHRSAENAAFYVAGTEMIRYFYLYGKHVMGLGFNMLFFLGGTVGDAQMAQWGWPLFLLNAGTLSITVFLHTLRFKGLLRPRHAFSLYVGMAMGSYLAIPPLMRALLWHEPVVGYLVAQGVLVNTRWRRGDTWQMRAHYAVAMAVVCAMRHARAGHLDTLLAMRP